MNKKILVGIQSRLKSTRFPKKAFIKILDTPLIVHVIKRMQRLTHPHLLVVLVPDSEVSEFSKLISTYNIDIPILGGDETDVLSRYYHAMQYFHADFMMRVTGDNPLISIPLADSIITHHLNYQADLSHYLQNPLGTGVEIISFKALEQCYIKATTPEEKEHVTYYLYTHSKDFIIEEPISPYILPQYPHLSIDTPEDLVLITKLLEQDPYWDITNLDTKIKNH